MTVEERNIIPGQNGKTFETNAKIREDLKKIEKAVKEIKGIKEVKTDPDKFPKSFTVFSDTLVSVEDVQQAVIGVGFHALPKGFIDL